MEYFGLGCDFVLYLKHRTVRLLQSESFFPVIESLIIIHVVEFVESYGLNHDL